MVLPLQILNTSTHGLVGQITEFGSKARIRYASNLSFLEHKRSFLKPTCRRVGTNNNENRSPSAPSVG